MNKQTISEILTGLDMERQGEIISSEFYAGAMRMLLALVLDSIENTNGG